MVLVLGLLRTNGWGGCDCSLFVRVIGPHNGGDRVAIEGIETGNLRIVGVVELNVDGCLLKVCIFSERRAIASGDYVSSQQDAL